MPNGFGPATPPPPASRRLLARILVWTLAGLVSAAAIVGAGFWLGTSQYRPETGVIGVSVPRGGDGGPVQDVALSGLTILLALDLANSAEIDIRFHGEGPPPRFLLETTASRGDTRFHLATRIRDAPRMGETSIPEIAWSADISGEGEEIFAAMATAIRRASTLIRRDRRFQHGTVPRPEPVATRLARDLAAAARWFADAAETANWGPAGKLQLIRMLEHAAALDPSDPAIASRLASRLAQAYLDRHLLEEITLERAADLLARAAAANPVNAEYLLARCQVRRAQARHEEAIADCAAAAAQAPRAAALETAHNYLELGQSEEALRWYRRALEQTPDGPAAMPAWRGMAIAYYLGGAREQAAYWMGRAAIAHPSDPVARGWHAALLDLAGRRSEARREAGAFFALPAIPPRQPGTLPRTHLLAIEYDGRHGLIANTLAELRREGAAGETAPAGPIR